MRLLGTCTHQLLLWTHTHPPMFYSCITRYFRCCFRIVWTTQLHYSPLPVPLFSDKLVDLVIQVTDPASRQHEGRVGSATYTWREGIWHLRGMPRVGSRQHIGRRWCCAAAYAWCRSCSLRMPCWLIQHDIVHTGALSLQQDLPFIGPRC